MGRAPCCDKANVKRGPWSPEEDRKLKDYIHNHGTGGNWIALPHKAELKRCGKSCRLRWLNYLRPNIKHGDFSEDEDRIICSLFAAIGSRWSIIAAQLPGRTDNDIKNYWNTKLKKKLMLAHGLQPLTVNSHHRSKKQQHLFFSAEAPSTSTPFPPGDPLSLPYLSTLDLSHHYSSESQCYDNSSTSLLMFGGNGEQQMMSSSCSDSGRGGLGLYMEFCNNGSAHGHDTAVVTAEDLAMESFVFQDDHRKAPLLLSGAANLDHFQYGANTSCGGSIKDPADSLFCSYREEKSGSSPTSAGVSQQGRFMY